jgi:hypothetical protein
LPKLQRREFIQCVMCQRLVDRSEISFLRVRVDARHVVRVPVCHLCQVDPGKIRYYIAQQRKKP